MGFLLQCNDMHLAEKAFLCATVGAEGLTQGELAELYNLLKPPLQVTGKHYTDCSVGLDSFGIFTNAFGDAMFKSNGLLCKKPEKSPNCLGSVNRAVVRVVCHPAALG